MFKNIDYAYDAIGVLETNTGFKVDIDSQHDIYDMIIKINQQTFYVITQKHAKNFNYGVLSAKVKKMDKSDNTILIADYLPPKTAKQLKENKINYLDASGNAFINSGELFIYIKGERPLTKASTNETRVFQEAGLKLLLVLISQPDTLQYSYRELSEYAQVSIGSISHIFNELEENNYLLRTKSKRTLKNIESLIEQWTIHYSNILKPRFFRRSFKTNLIKREFENLLNSADLNFDLGGEYAAEKISNHLMSNNFTLYSNEETVRIVKALKLIPSEEGNINLYAKFWSEQLSLKYNGLVPPLVIYAELMNSGLERNIEAANIILTNGL